MNTFTGKKIKELFGKKYQKRFFKDLKNHVIYSHDCSAIKPYCAAISIVPFIYNGASNLAGDSKAPQHLASYCGSYINLMYSLAGGFSGAIAEIGMLTYFHYFAKKDFGVDYITTHKVEIVNYFQQIIYSMNSPLVLGIISLYSTIPLYLIGIISMLCSEKQIILMVASLIIMR